MYRDFSEKFIGNHTEQEEEMKKLIRGALAGVLSVAMLVTPSTVSNAVGEDATFTEAVLNDDWTVTVTGINWNNSYEGPYAGSLVAPYIGCDYSEEGQPTYEPDFSNYLPLIPKPETGDTSTCISDPLTERYAISFDESGTYKFYIAMHENTSPSNPCSCVQAITGTYTSPDDEMNAPTNIRWDGYTLQWDGEPDGLYCVDYEYIYPNSTEGAYTVLGGKYMEYRGKTSHNFANEISRITYEGNFSLNCTVKQVSANPAIKANSQKVAAPVLSIKGTEGVSDQLDLVESPTPEGITNIFDTPEKIDTLMVGMTKDTSVAQKIKDIEDTYVGANNITVAQPYVEQEVQEMGINPSKVSILGAGLNANNSETVTLKISKSSNSVTGLEEWNNRVILDIKLEVGSTNKTNLDVPVSITMPLPDGVQKNKLAICHIHNDGSKEEIRDFRFNADGTFTFSVKDFSTFVFANKSEKTVVTQENRDNQKRTTYRTPVENAINQAVATSGTAEISGITALSYDEMKKLSKNPDAKLVMYYTYNDEKYKVIVTGKDAVVDPSIPWYGPLYLAGKYGNSITAGK